MPAQCNRQEGKMGLSRFGLLLGMGLAGLSLWTGCATTTPPSSLAISLPPPQDELQAKLAQEPIKAFDVLQVHLGEGATATVSQQYQVDTDGTIQLAGGAKVTVAGKTVREAQEAIHEALEAASRVEQALDVSLTEYYLVQVAPDGSRQLTRVPLRTDVRVKDAVRHIDELDRKVVWVVRPSLGRTLGEQVLPVDAEMILKDRSNPTNYDLQCGDWLFVVEEPSQGVARLYGAMTSVFTSPKPEKTANNGRPTL